MKKKRQQSKATRERIAKRQEITEKLRRYGVRLKDAKNQSRGEASKVTKLWRKVKEFAASRDDRFQFVKNKGIGKLSKKARKKLSDAAALPTGIFVPKAIGRKVKVTRQGELVGESGYGNLTRIESFFIPFTASAAESIDEGDLEDLMETEEGDELDTDTLGDVDIIIRKKAQELGWKSYTVSPVFDGRPTASKFDETTLKKEMRSYIKGNEDKGRKLTGFLVQRVKIDRAKVKGAIEKAKAKAKAKPSKKAAPKRAKRPAKKAKK